MSVQEETLLWKYIDGDCTPDELHQVEALLADNVYLEQKLRIMKNLHRHLQEIELEQPSLRFTRNVMENLPTLYQQGRFDALIRPQYIYLLIGLLVVGGLLSTWLGLGQNGTSTLPGLDLASRVVSSWEIIFERHGMQLWSIMILGIALLLLFDRWLGRQFGKNSPNV